MKLPKIKLPKMPNPVEIAKGLMPKSPRAKRDQALLKEYEAGRILQVDNNVDNKKHFLKLETA